ncbi:hypothetical protein HAR83_000649 [Vibrio metschnikovii]|nr:hypothetical protein [Vibrio metschnikovii]
MKADDETRFPDFKQLPKPIINDSEIIIEDEYWLYSIKLVKEKNQDLYICFLDKSKESSYYTQAPMIIRKYGNDYVAIKAVANVCEDFAK